MTPILLFIVEVALCIGISVVVIVLLRPLLRDVLVETCGTVNRAEFWVMFTQLMLAVVPLLVVMFFAPTDLISGVNTVVAIKDTLFRSLLGTFIALATVGQVIWRSIGVANNRNVSELKGEAG